MRFSTTRLAGVQLIEPEPLEDGRGYFMRTFCCREFETQGLETSFVQHSTSFTAARSSIRGMHFQAPPHAETKVVRCLRGSIWDIVIDLRRASPDRGKWQAFELSHRNRRQLFIPPGFAHGFQTLTDDVEVSYLISAYYRPDASRGVRHDDPAFAIEWPLAVSVMSQKDRDWPDWNDHWL